MDDETKAEFAKVSTQLNTMMACMDDGFERAIERFRMVDAMLAVQNETTRSTNMLLQILVNNSLDHGKRITDLENKP